MLLEVRVRPNSAKNKILSYRHPNFIEIALEAKPEKNEANLLLCKFLAKCLNIEKDLIKIIKGKSSTKKILKLEGLTEDEFWRRLKV
ncbi:MAG: DUF167 domain-containing protein [Caldimicrobium sp.]